MRTMPQRVLRLFTNTLVSLAVVGVLWFFALWAFNVKPFIGKNPFDVYKFLFEVPAASENRDLVMAALGQTMIDASIGFAVGIFLAFFCMKLAGLASDALGDDLGVFVDVDGHEFLLGV